MRKSLLSFLFLILLSHCMTTAVYAESSTTYTYFISTTQQWTKTQDAYIVDEVLFSGLNLKEPSDMIYKDGLLYICDTGNARVLRIKDGEAEFTYDSGMSIPTGICMDNDKNLFVADASGKVLKLNYDGELLLTITKPEDFTFGTMNAFKPQKVAVDNNGAIYVISEGSFDGLMQFSAEGEFLGYFAANNTKVGLWEGIQRLIMSPERVAKMFNIIPKSLHNVAADREGLIYTITQTADRDALKKHNVSGQNILQASAEGAKVTEDNFSDLTIGQHGQIYAVSETGVIYEYDDAGRLLFAFGGRATTSERAGLMTVASGIAADENDNVYVLDKERGLVHHFVPTAFAGLFHEAISLFNSGRYEESSAVWKQVLRLDAMSQRAHYGLGMVYYNQMDYKNAADAFYTANSRTDYSNAFWEIRNIAIQRNIGWIALGLAVLVILNKLLKRRLKINPSHTFELLKRVLVHPVDAMYDIKETVSSKTATVVYGGVLVIFVLQMTGMGYLYRNIFASYITPLYLGALFLVPLTLWVLGNYMVSTINDGEGSLRQVFSGTAFSLAPYLFITPIVILASWVLTYNERFLIDIALTVAVSWSALNLFIMVREVHNYSVKETVKIIAVTLFLMLVAVVAFSIFYIFIDKVVKFIYELGLEVLQRARNQI